MKQSARAWLIDILAIVFGSALVAAGLVLFTIPNNIAPGGVSGLATALAHITPLSVGVWTLGLNVPGPLSVRVPRLSRMTTWSPAWSVSVPLSASCLPGG